MKSDLETPAAAPTPRRQPSLAAPPATSASTEPAKIVQRIKFIFKMLIIFVCLMPSLLILKIRYNLISILLNKAKLQKILMIKNTYLYQRTKKRTEICINSIKLCYSKPNRPT